MAHFSRAVLGRPAELPAVSAGVAPNRIIPVLRPTGGDRQAGGRATGAPPPRIDEIFCGSVETVLALVSLVSI